MFDDPKKELARLQRELLAANEQSWEEEEDPEEALDEMKEMLRREDWEENSREPLYRSYTQENDEETEVIRYKTAAKEDPKPKKTGNKGLIVTAILEAAALLAFVVWWMLWGR